VAQCCSLNLHSGCNSFKSAKRSFRPTNIYIPEKERSAAVKNVLKFYVLLSSAIFKYYY